MSYQQMVSLSYPALRGAAQIQALGNERDVQRIGTPATIADAVAIDERIAQANAIAAAFIQKLEAILAGDRLDVAPDELRAENIAIKREAIAVIEMRIEIRKKLQAEFADYKAQRKAELIAAQAARNVDSVPALPPMACPINPPAVAPPMPPSSPPVCCWFSQPPSNGPITRAAKVALREMPMD